MQRESGHRLAAAAEDSGHPERPSAAPAQETAAGSATPGGPAGRLFRFEIRVPYAHVDQMRVVYYANYFVYFEMARAALLREADMPYPEMERRGVMLPVVEAHCEYRRPARYDDLLVVLSRCVSLKGPRLRIEYEVQRDGETLATGHTVHVCLSPDGRVLKPSPELQNLVGEG